MSRTLGNTGKRLKTEQDAIKKRTRQELRTLHKGLKGASSLMRGIGWSSLISLGLDLSISAFTPGISKVAARNDQLAMSENPLDSQASYTMRQRAVAAIHDSLMSTRQVIGNEANFMHR